MLGSRSRDDLGPITCPHPFFQLTFPISAQWGSHPLFSRNRGPAESVRGCDSDHLSSKGSARLSLPLKLGVFTGIRGTPSEPATPEGPASPRRNHEGKESNDKCPVRSQQAAARSSIVGFRNLFTQESQPPSGKPYLY